MQQLKEGYVQSIISVPEPLREPLIALLAEIGYEAFEEVSSGVKAYIPEHSWQEEEFVAQLAILPGGPFQVEHGQLEPKNWNEEWENNYPSVYIDDFCQIVPSFREVESGYVHSLKIDPKMSFGTGHHETTRLMIRQMKELDLTNRIVLDMGCGTAILGILAAKLGAKEVLGIDIDPWSFDNGQENIRLNQTHQVQLALGDVSAIPPKTFDYILANINRNVLLADIPAYAQHLAPNGTLVLSGFFLSDATAIETCCRDVGMIPVRHLEEKEWLSILCKTKTIEP
ncbi:MAG: 50S ribosomal protein L11 methyltransferase [Bacteroidota bacterium]